MQPDSIQITHAQRRLGARTALQPLRRECSERSMTGVIGANGAGRGTCGAAAQGRLARDGMGSSPSHEHHDTSERGAHANITVDVFLVGTPSSDVGPFERRD